MINTIIKRKKNIIAIIIIAILIIVLIMAVIFSMNYQVIEISHLESSDYHELTYEGSDYQYNTSIVSIVLLGIDSEDTNIEQGQADAIEILLLDRKNEKIQIISIPRDTMTEIKLYDVSGNNLGWQKQHLNLAYGYGNTPEAGCMYTMQAISRMMDNIPMTYYAALDLSNLLDIHDIVGNLKVTIPNDSLSDVNVLWQKGQSVDITKDNVELYLRTRDTEADFSNEPRMERQQEYLIAYFNCLKDKLLNDFDTTVSKMYSISKKITTNLTYNDMEDFANMVLKYKFNSEEDFYVLKGKNVSGTYHDEFEVDQDTLKSLIINLFYIKGD